MSVARSSVRLPALVTRRRTLSSVTGTVLVRLSAPVVLIAVWQLAADARGSMWFPPPSAIVAQIYHLWFSAGFPRILTPAVAADVVPSFARMLGGWAIAAGVGICVGMVIGRSRVVAQLTEPVIHFLRSVPGPALLPIFLIVLGTGTPMRVSLIAFASVWPILLNTIDGVRAVDRTQLETARIFGLPWRAGVFRIMLPAAMPKILAGLSVALTVALTLMVVSELTVATDGVGYQIQRASQLFLMSSVWAGVVLIAIIGLILNSLFALAERRALRWYRGMQRHAD
jgi:ABC-type nitrate/sulfonate/bicarbonate transport system permease component